MEFLAKLPDYLILASAWVGALVLVARSLDAVVALTPTVKDDAILSKVQQTLGVLSDLLMKAGTIGKSSGVK